MIRLENKYLLENKKHKFELIRFLLTNGFHRIFNDRYNNSIYFDDINLKFFHDSEEGNEIRRKVRFRYYNFDEKKDISNYFFEIKKSNAHYKEKISQKINLTDKTVNKEVNIFQNQINIKKIKPIIKTGYSRSYSYSEKYGRITIDENIKFEKVSWKKFRKNFFFYNPVSINKIIIEHKIENNYKDFELIPLTKIRFSKYCEAIKYLNIS